MLRNSPPIVVCSHRSLISLPDIRILQTASVISYRQYHLIRYQPLIHQLQRHLLRHFLYHQPGLSEIICALQHLPGAHTAVFRFIGLDILHSARFPAPCMVNQKFCIYSKHLIEQIFIVIVVSPSQRTTGNISHRIDSLIFQLSGIASSHPPKIRQRSVAPQKPAVAHLVQLCNPHSELVRRQMLGYDIHSNLGKIQISADSRRGRNTRSLQHIPHYLRRQLPCRYLVGIQIMRRIYKHLVNRIHMNILRRHIFQINIVNTPAVFQIERHPRRRRYKIHLQYRHIFQLDCMGRSPCEFLPRSFLLPFCINFL